MCYHGTKGGENLNNEIGKLIKHARTKKNVTQAELAKRVGLATVTVRQYENGSREPNIETLRKIALALGVSIYSLVSFDDASSLVEENINENRITYGENWEQYERIRIVLPDLNHKGAERAAQAVEDIAKIPEYQNIEKVKAREKENERVIKFWKENVDPDYDE